MTAEENKAIVRRLSDAYNRHDLDTVRGFFAPDYFNHTSGLRGPEGVQEYSRAFFSAFPDYVDTVEDLIGEGDKVAVRTVGRGTHKGEFSGIPPTGKRVEIAAHYIYRIVDGKDVEEWDLSDGLTFFQQLGVIPPIGENEA